MTLIRSTPVPFDAAYLRFLAAEEAATDRLRAFYAQTRAELEAFLHDPPVKLTASEQQFYAALQAEVKRLSDNADVQAAAWVTGSAPSAFVEGAKLASPGIAFNAVHDNAVRALSGYDLNLITQMNSAMQRIVQQQIAVGLLEGATRETVSQRILASGLSNIPHWRTVEERAAAIARTEIMRAFNAGNLAGIVDTGAMAAKWITGRDERVCSICGPRDGKLYRIGASDDPELMALDVLVPPPAHVKCRCTIRAAYDFGGEKPQIVEPEGGVVEQVPIDMKRVKQWQAQPTKSLQKLLERTDLHPSDRAEIALALANKTGKTTLQAAASVVKPPPAVPQAVVEAKQAVAAVEQTAAVVEGAAERATAEWARSVWGTKTGEFYKSLSKIELDAVTRYSGSDFKAINTYLRKRAKGTVTKITKTIEGRIEGLNAAIARTPIPKTIRVTRGSTLSAFDHFDPALFVGKTIREPGFLSTSTRSLDGFGGYNGACVFNITAPKGTPAFYMEPVSQVKGEQEILFGAGTRLRIDSVRKIESRTTALKTGRTWWKIEATIVPG